ncbi:MAG: 1-deoxy-D-xylulose-5-phosphate synthase [Candidatus Lightella neohaematopini]|nr:1-deoxy-D-xylulose-5-phosphate synthase [Candidatus Lightella neohaematopini]
MIMKKNKYTILTNINNPVELRKLSIKDLDIVCYELREFLLDTVNESSGHLASGLGVVELTIALHYVYNTPIDFLIWDTGHQTYPHKIITNRRNFMSTIRQINGLHPFPSREESKYDVLTVGHSSTSISVSSGIAVAMKNQYKNRRVVCVIGDGAMTAGISFEAINYAGYIKPNILIILNDNGISISNNIGALNKYLSNIKKYNNLTKVDKTIKQTTNILNNNNIYTDNTINLFKYLGFNYIGPINGHNIKELIKILNILRLRSGPQLLHLVTIKGYGYLPAEQDPISWHSVPKYSISNNNLLLSNTISYSNIFGDWLCYTAAKDNKLVAITPAMSYGSGMNKFACQYPKQFFDVAIAEQHAVTFAVGLSIGGYKPVVSIYSTFLQRAYDQIIHDVALQNIPILFVIDRGGIVGFDGKTHQGSFDLSFLRCVPNIIIMTPSNENECRLMLYTGYHYQDGPSAVRYPKRSITGGMNKITKLYKIPLGKGIIHRYGVNIAILNFGTLFTQALIVANKLNSTLVDMRFVKPLDTSLIKELSNNHKIFVTIEENSIVGGAGSAVNEFIMYNQLSVKVLNIGLPDLFINHGDQKQVQINLGLDSIGIYKKINNWLNKIIQ